MQDELQKMDEISRRVGVTYEVAQAALEEAEGDLAQAVVYAERDKATGGANLAAAGLSFMDELKKLIAAGEIRALRLKFGKQTIKEFPVSPGTALAVLAIVALAVLVTKLYIEVDRVPKAAETGATRAWEEQ